MYLAYSLLLTLGLIVLLPRFIFQAVFHGKYLSGFRERLGSIPLLQPTDRPAIWLHCVSVGETQAARPLVDQLRAKYPQYSLVVSTVTLTGQRLAREVFRDQAALVFYFPFDWRWSVRRAFKRVKPVAVLIMETELWPNFLNECRHQEIPVALVNGRISRQSFRRYRLIRFLLKRVLSVISVAGMQSEADAERIRSLGLGDNRVFVTGNVKFDAGTVSSTHEVTTEIKMRFNFGNELPLILAASTHSPEERIILESFRAIRRSINARLLLAPRHPERFSEVASVMESTGFKWARRTNTPAESDKTVDVILLDTIGELPATYSLADIVFVGGSIVDRGGHNLLEPAAVGACIVTGAHTHNFHAIVDLLIKNQAIYQLPPLDSDHAAIELQKLLVSLLADSALRNLTGARAKNVFEENRGATGKTIDILTPFLTKRIEPKTTIESSLHANVSA